MAVVSISLSFLIGGVSGQKVSSRFGFAAFNDTDEGNVVTQRLDMPAGVNGGLIGFPFSLTFADPDHGFISGDVVDVHWSPLGSEITYSSVLRSVTLDVVTEDEASILPGAEGDAPSGDINIAIISFQQELVLDVDASTLQLFAFGSSALGAIVDVREDAGSLLVQKLPDRHNGWLWWDDLGFINPLAAGGNITSVRFSNGSTSPASLFLIYQDGS